MGGEDKNQCYRRIVFFILLLWKPPVTLVRPLYTHVVSDSSSQTCDRQFINLFQFQINK